MRGLLLGVLLLGAVLGQEGSEQSTRHPEDNLITTTPSAEGRVALPEPVNISASVGVDSSASGNVPRVEIDTDGIPVVHGVVMPDDPTDKKVWRNARVLNNVLVERQQKSASIDSDSSAIKEQGDMFVYRPESPRFLNDGDSFQPSAVDSSAFSPSLPYPAFYYQRFYKDAQEEKQLPDSLAVETDEAENTTEGVESDTDGRGFNIKLSKKNTGITKQKTGSVYGKDLPVTGRPIYYVSGEEAKAIHDDHSPYNYEPAQQQANYYAGFEYSTQAPQQKPSSKQDVQYYLQQQQLLLQQQQFQQQQQQLQQQQQKQQTDSPNRAGFFPQNKLVPGQVVAAPTDAYVIREQNYNNGAGPSFTVPVPVASNEQYNKQYLDQQAQLQYAQQLQQYQQYYGQLPHYLYVSQQNPQKYAPQQPTQQPLEFLGNKIREQVQKARDKLHEVTDPVVDPIMEAGQKISTNLGLPERVNKINEKVATPGVLVPLAMVGGAALALGGLATTIHLTNAESRNQTLKAIGLGNTKIADKLHTLMKVKRSIDSDEYDAPAPGDELDEGKQNVLDHVLSALNGPQKSFLSQLQRTGFDQWQKTPCAKRIFCDVMIQQNDDAIVLMEKRMSTFLSL